MIQKIVKIIFKQGNQAGSLGLCSQTVLIEFLSEYQSKDNEFDKISSYIFKDKYEMVEKVFLG